MRVIVTGGGSGGHIYPAIAIADKIKEKEPQSEILYIGNDIGLEKDNRTADRIPYEAGVGEMAGPQEYLQDLRYWVYHHERRLAGSADYEEIQT